MPTLPVLLWISEDAMGTEWTVHSLSSIHNQLTSASQHFSVGVNRSDLVPPFGAQYTETTAYTSLVPIGNSSALVIYGKNKPGSRGGKTYSMQLDLKSDDDTAKLQAILDKCNETGGLALIPAQRYTVSRPPVCYGNSRYWPPQCSGGFMRIPLRDATSQSFN